MADYRHRREGDNDESFVGHVRAADTGISIGWRWANIITTLVCFGFAIGVFYATTNALKDSIVELRAEVQEFRRISSTSTLEIDRLKTSDQQNREQISELKDTVRELRSQVDNMRSMREAYVYDSAKDARRTLMNKATTPP